MDQTEREHLVLTERETIEPPDVVVTHHIAVEISIGNAFHVRNKTWAKFVAETLVRVSCNNRAGIAHGSILIREVRN